MNNSKKALNDYFEVEGGKIMPNAVELAEFTDESWQQYDSDNLQLREIIEGSGLVCGGNSSSLESVSMLIELAANSDMAALILGETGTGKELVAEATHNLSHRGKQGKDLVTVNIGSYSKELVYPELFGYEKGAFTGAIDKREGKFEAANDSTLFLDEIGTMSLEAQVNLLRVIEKGVIDRLGSNKPKKINVRIIAATNENLEEMVNEGKFRKDLYYRLNVFIIKLPPLRERPWDIPALVQYFSNCCANEKNRKKVKYDQKLFKAMIWHEWQGNVRQLENFIKLTQALSRDKICLEDIKSIHTDPSYYQLKIAYREYEENSEWAKLILKFADIAAKMFMETWEILENAWEKWQKSRTVSFSNLELEKEIFYQELDNLDSQRLKEIIQGAWKELRRFLKSEGHSGIQNSNCYTMLMSCYGSKHNVKNIEKAVKWILKSVLEKLEKMNLNLSHQLERENYDRFQEFFGKTHRSVWAWKGK